MVSPSSGPPLRTRTTSTALGLVVLGYYNNMVNFCDILGADSFPRERCYDLLKTMRKLYPGSRFWMLEESRMLAGERRPEEAVKLLMLEGSKSGLKQIEAFRWFETSLNSMYLGEWEACADGFIKVHSSSFLFLGGSELKQAVRRP